MRARRIWRGVAWLKSLLLHAPKNIFDTAWLCGNCLRLSDCCDCGYRSWSSP